MTNEEFLKSITLDGEEWRDVVGYEGLYTVSNHGRVASLCRKLRTKHGWRTLPASLMTPQPHKKGYKVIILRNQGAIQHWLIHRLVAIAFIPNPYGYQEIDHIDGCKTNNEASNLRWCDRIINMNNPISIERLSKWAISRYKNGKHPHERPIVGISLSDGSVLHFPSQKEARKHGFSKSCISACVLGNSAYHRGYKWMYLTDYENLLSISQSTLK